MFYMEAQSQVKESPLKDEIQGGRQWDSIFHYIMILVCLICCNIHVKTGFILYKYCFQHNCWRGTTNKTSKRSKKGQEVKLSVALGFLLSDQKIVVEQAYFPFLTSIYNNPKFVMMVCLLKTLPYHQKQVYCLEDSKSWPICLLYIVNCDIQSRLKLFQSQILFSQIMSNLVICFQSKMDAGQN